MTRLVQMKHKQTGVVKSGYFGFSWTSFFFGGFPALFRGDLGYGLGVLVAAFILGGVSFGLLWFLIGLIWAAIYNKNYTHRLLQEGYEFNDMEDRVGDAKRALGIDSSSRAG